VVGGAADAPGHKRGKGEDTLGNQEPFCLVFMLKCDSKRYPGLLTNPGIYQSGISVKGQCHEIFYLNFFL
jgi:hypothetical protein